jgi:hypothetical protein
MQTLRQDISYALRQMRLSPVFTLTAMLTLALGIGATTAIFSLIYSVMLKSLPVVDPSSLYRIGAGTDCCVKGGPQDDWGMYSIRSIFASRPRPRSSSRWLRSRLPECSSACAAGKATIWPSPCAANSSPATTSAPSAFARSPDAPSCSQRRSGLRPAGSHAELSRLAATVRFRSFGRRIDVHRGGHPFTIAGIAPPGFFGETLRSNPPELWLPLQQEPLVNAQNSLLGNLSLRGCGSSAGLSRVRARPGRPTAYRNYASMDGP